MSFLRWVGLGGIAGSILLRQILVNEDEKRLRKRFEKGPSLGWMPPSRENTLKKAAAKRKYDIVIIGGGSAGAGAALDAASRGHSVLLLEKSDFSSGTSSKSTKLIHGGIRYLEKAFKELDYKQLSLVVEGLRERNAFLRVAPYLTKEVGILLPFKNRYIVPYFWLGTKVYDWLSGKYGITHSHFISKKRILQLIPSISPEKVCGGMVYYDGQMNDSRVNAMLVSTAVYHGADALNYVEVEELLKENGRVSGVIARDREKGKPVRIRCAGVINATGPQSDSIRKKDNPAARRLIAPSIGTHLVLDAAYTGKFGLLNPSTKNGSVLFLLPWQGASIAGTTDTPTSDTGTPRATSADVAYVLDAMTEFVSSRIKPKAKNILSAWAGVRPLALDLSSKKKGERQALLRSHLIEVSGSGLVTVAGGKWTSYREMAEEAVSKSEKVFGLPQRSCLTKWIKLVGSHNFNPNTHLRLSRDFGVPGDIARHLVSSYGDRAEKVCRYGNKRFERISPKHPYTVAEVLYLLEHEHVRKISDFLGRRTRFGFLDVREARASIPKLAGVFQRHLKWSSLEKKREAGSAREYTDTLGYSLLIELEKKEEASEKTEKALKKVCESEDICKPKKVLRVFQDLLPPATTARAADQIAGRKTLSLAEALRVFESVVTF